MTAAIRCLFELHEDQVPYLDEPIAILVRRTRRPTGDVITVIVEDLATWTARTGVTHRPEIVAGGDTDDTVFGKACNLAPEFERFIVGMVNRRKQAVRIEAPFTRQQCPGIEDRFFLEVIAEAEIAQHLEKRVVARGVAHIVEIVVLATGAHAFLAAGRPIGRRFLKAGERVLERNHARIHEHQRRVVIGHQRRTGHLEVVHAREEIQKGAANVVGREHETAGNRSYRRRQAGLAAG